MNRLNFINMSNNVLLKIAEYVGFPAIHMIRKTCSHFHNVFDTHPPNVHFDRIEILTDQNSIRTLYFLPDDFYSVRYKRTQNGCSVGNGDTEKILENQHFEDIFIQDFQFNLSLQQDLLGVLELSWSHGELPLLERIRQTLNSRAEKLKVHELILNLKNRQQVEQILPFLDSEELKILDFGQPEVWGDSYFTMEDIEEFSKLDQWKSVKRFELSHGMENSRCFNYFLHASEVRIQVKILYLTDFVVVKEAFFNDRTLISFSITYEDFADKSSLLNLLRTPSYINDDGENWYFRNPRSVTVIHIQHDERRSNICQKDENLVPDEFILRDIF